MDFNSNRGPEDGEKIEKLKDNFSSDFFNFTI